MSRRAIFDYPNTCPRIDKAKSQAESALEGVLSDLLEEACPLLSGGLHRQQILSDWLQRAFEAVEDSFETVRSTNEEMRREAERQIESLAEELHALEASK